MKATLLAVGKAKQPLADVHAHYLKLLDAPGRLPLQVVEVKSDDALSARIPADAHVVALEAGGHAMTSEAWAGWLDERRLAARDLCLMLGGPHGLAPEAVERSNESLSLGPQTIAHQLARAVLLEQLFRATKILAGEPYHY